MLTPSLQTYNCYKAYKEFVKVTGEANLPTT